MLSLPTVVIEIDEDVILVLADDRGLGKPVGVDVGDVREDLDHRPLVRAGARARRCVTQPVGRLQERGASRKELFAEFRGWHR